VFEQQVLLLCAAMELDTQIAALCAQAQDASNRPYPTFALALALFDDPAWDIISSDRPLRYWRLVTVNTAGVQPLTVRSLQADLRIVNYLKGLNTLDENLHPYLTPLTTDGNAFPLPPSQQASVQATIEALQRASRHPTAVVQLVGADAASQQLVAQAVAAELGRYPYRLPTPLLPAAATDLDVVGRLCQREGRLLPVVFYLDAHGSDGASGDSAEKSTALVRFLNQSWGIFIVGTREGLSGVGQPGAVVTVDKPTTSEQTDIWAAALQEAETAATLGDRHHHGALLSGQFHLNAVTIQQIAESVTVEARRAEALSGVLES
ncbi:MAG: hypothetical protein WBA10_01695, partial [Elainellaceae cyanobacterium]